MTSPQWFVVERITGERKNDDGETTHFRVKWANYPDAESTWEPAARVKRAGWAIQVFREAEEKRRREQRQRALQKAAFQSQPAPTLRTPPRQAAPARARATSEQESGEGEPSAEQGGPPQLQAAALPCTTNDTAAVEAALKA